MRTLSQLSSWLRLSSAPPFFTIVSTAFVVLLAAFGGDWLTLGSSYYGPPPPSPTAPSVQGDYRLQSILSSSVGTPPALANLGSNTFGTATVDGVPRTVLNFAANNGVAFSPTTGVIANDA